MTQITKPQRLADLRAAGWSGIPSSPGVYWWYFPRTALDDLRISQFCDTSRLRLRTLPDGEVCLYHGMANNLSQRVEWHAAQKLTLGSLNSGFLSTFRFTLLALNDFDYWQGEERIDDYFDGLSVAWQATSARQEAEELERTELGGEYHFPLNIQGNRGPELEGYLRHLKSARKAYKQRFLQNP